MTISSVFSGTEICFLHLGQGPFLPANLSLTENRLKQLGHVTWIGMGNQNNGTEKQEGPDELHSFPDDHPSLQADDRRPPSATAHIVLYQPEIPQNTGNIGRSCVATGAKLWLVGQKGFEITNTRLKRAGMDYWQHLQCEEVESWQRLQQQLPTRRQWVFSRFARRAIWDAPLQTGDAFIFGCESAGLPGDILDLDSPYTLNLPTLPEVRSLNLATTVGIVLYQLLARCPDARPRTAKDSPQ